MAGEVDAVAETDAIDGTTPPGVPRASAAPGGTALDPALGAPAHEHPGTLPAYGPDAGAETHDRALGTASLLATRERGGPWWLPGVVGQPPVREPDWAVFVREAVAAAPAAPADVPVADRDYPGLTGFELVVAPFADRAAER
ncbi:type 2 lantipeptide synthetase LanM, partial [Streptomyces sp. SID3915]|nr:type 2 lantipeptide synthetase LanM [Streptomyces sp. SID3915]